MSLSNEDLQAIRNIVAEAVIDKPDIQTVRRIVGEEIDARVTPLESDVKEIYDIFIKTASKSYK